jgi:hypothetical protein
VKPLGPIQVYVAPATVETLNFNVLPALIGPLFDAVTDWITLTVRAAMDDVTDKLQVLLAMQSKPEEADTVSAVLTLLIRSAAVVEPL